MTRSMVSFIVLWLLLPVETQALAQDPLAIRDALAKPILSPKQTLAEVRAFVQERLPKMPELTTSEAWEREAERLRSEALERVILRGHAKQWFEADCKVVWLDEIEGGPGYKIRKLRFEAIPGVWIPALLYEPMEITGKIPAVLNVNGHDGQGKAAAYKQIRCINLAKRGVIALNVEWFGMGQLRSDGYRHGLINAIDLCGTSGIATHYLYLKRSIDVLLSHPKIDPSRIGVTGLSGGGWQTIFLSGLDTRVSLSAPVAGYSSFFTRTEHGSDLGDSEQTPCDLATVLDYAHLTAMLAPRASLLTFNLRDNCCFAAPHALPPLAGAAVPVFSLFDAEANLRFHVNVEPGDHNYGRDNRQALYRMIRDHWQGNDGTPSAEEIPSEQEVKSPEELNVQLPDDNLDIQNIAMELSRDLPVTEGDRDVDPRDDMKRRLKLGSIVRPVSSGVEATILGLEDLATLKVTRWTLKVSGAISVPIVECVRDDSTSTVILFAEEGKSSAAKAVERWLDAGVRVIAVDPFYFGESQVAERDYLWALMVATIGERPLGLQVGQLMAVARWRRSLGDTRITLAGQGPRASTITLVAAALEPEDIDAIEISEPLGSLKELIHQGRTVEASPELFCFGLLESFDIPQIRALIAPRPIQIVEN